MTINQKTVSNVLAQLSLKSAVENGMSPHDFTRLTGITEAELAHPDGRIPAHKHIAMLNLLEPGYQTSERLESFSDYSFRAPISTLLAIVTNCPTLTKAFDQFLRYRILIGNVDTVKVKRAGQIFEFEYVLDGAGRSSSSAFYNFLLLIQLAEQYNDDKPYPAHIELTGNPFSATSQLSQLCGSTVQFGQSRNRMLLKSSSADLPHRRYNEFTDRIICGQADADIIRFLVGHSFSSRIEDFVTKMIRESHSGHPFSTPLEEVCERLGISRSTLHRRLQGEGTNFQTILARARLAEAKRLLPFADFSVAAVSDHLGFSSPSAFSRFFLENSGKSPLRYKLENGSVAIRQS
ncbi:helix-turn-helix domain-containing protein [Paraburkholderia susongensis]|uniref:Transcriptional regulator, AraC family n=1 Tax=Paraburkholderia susongensis TaxID=1515439 RepID=A0A1X7LIJ9_9BURK|nr:helix-turn-helix domain-containing protein [Paraburkholderia susongensis]SMG53615.1 transcriptional regulator, AraC family [Paraburkholderia susongensis]